MLKFIKTMFSKNKRRSVKPAARGGAAGVSPGVAGRADADELLSAHNPLSPIYHMHMSEPLGSRHPQDLSTPCVSGPVRVHDDDWSSPSSHGSASHAHDTAPSYQHSSPAYESSSSYESGSSYDGGSSTSCD